ncbi:MAG: hypothetical protein KME07_20520 [Pegethrix bostrychoides GSE-TBD4-15B]|jgi:hypothetical protein|uniref:Uncharacterized protein n=1 Tax=Pegethrix bostrychoides GSE-TBD4-15B TaxID=2839662 RepID=A0A951U6M9_9CYAN|nr:hypothetical protein [Pegethrix bostrychoides GSE-TBD4-15B]
MVKFASSLIQSPDGRSQWIDPESEFLQRMQRRLIELSQHIQDLQNSGQAKTSEMEWLALHLHLSIIKALIAERLEQLNELTTYGTRS